MAKPGGDRALEPIVKPAVIPVGVVLGLATMSEDYMGICCPYRSLEHVQQFQQIHISIVASSASWPHLRYCKQRRSVIVLPFHK